MKESIRLPQTMLSLSPQKPLLSAKYEIQEEIARGGMGVIYRAIHTALNRPVAVKVLYPEYRSDVSFLKRFEREARALARLDHPNIIRIYDVSEAQDPYYIVMELFPGRDLKQLILERRSFPPLEACAMVLQAAEALSFAHGKGIIHRDIKPGNILVDRGGHVKITDFGIVAAADELSATPTGEILGTPEYMSPEQAQGEPIDGRSDLYSLGMVFYKMLTGRTPFEGISRPSVLGKLISDQNEFVLLFSSAVPSTIQELVRSLLRKQARERIPDARTLAAEIATIAKEIKECTPSKKEGSPLPAVHTLEKDSLVRDEASSIRISTPLLDLSPCITTPIGKNDARRQSGTFSIFLAGVIVFFIIGAIYLFLSQFIFSALTETTSLPDPKTTVKSIEVHLQQQATENPFRNEEGPIKATVTTAEAPTLPAPPEIAVILAPPIPSTPEGNRVPSTISEKREKQVEIVLNREEPIQDGITREEIPVQPINDNLPPSLHSAPGPLEQEQIRPFPAEAVTEPSAVSLPSTEELPGKAVQGEEIASSPALQEIANETVPPPSSSLSAPRPDLEVISDLLAEFKTAFEAQDMAALLQISEMSPERSRILEEMFRTYPIVKISYSDLSLTRDATALTIEVYKLIDREGDPVSPHKEWKKSRAIIRKKGERWGKLIW
ncbi:protein kinase domain-containing protein [Candidatus Manganitrophus noduliformans]|uniref:non-specific serine/threonine protein kinase n=1 Tax=Candidatus Manganitrophus noduliformans TaxID=2606439 RepID=A0A7X6I9E4_9BACT|nr:serine/threonine-protein kinase [Candidatus Manganitrophus noduliformans]NKE69295.1 serine/threonine protein kinase [Candidatus Manganitrophus noduliformans]